MASILISGGRPLNGEICVQGSKNAVLPMMAASLLLDGVSRLKGCPNISDVAAMAELLEKTGAEIWWENDTLCIDPARVVSVSLCQEDTKKTRASFLLLGAMLGRLHSCNMSYPGGCAIGSRPVDLHLFAMRQMGYEVCEEGRIICKGTRKQTATVNFSFPSVGATQNAIMAAVLGHGTTVLCNVAREPEVQELCRFLNSAGAEISGIGRSTLRINGMNRLHAIVYSVPRDRIVLGTYLIAALAAGGRLRLVGARAEELRRVIRVLTCAGAELRECRDCLEVCAGKRLGPFDYLVTAPYPGFPTDMQSQIMALASISDGTTVIEEQVFESRMAVAYELKRMGADIYLDDNRAIVNGVETLHGTVVNASDLRGAAALVIAGLAAEGKTEIFGYEYLKRGYEDIVRDLAGVGAEISLI